MIPGANVEPSRRRDWERYWFEFVVLMPVGCGDLLALSLLFFIAAIGFNESIEECFSICVCARRRAAWSTFFIILSSEGEIGF